VEAASPRRRTVRFGGYLTSQSGFLKLFLARGRASLLASSSESPSSFSLANSTASILVNMAITGTGRRVNLLLVCGGYYSPFPVPHVLKNSVSAFVTGRSLSIGIQYLYSGVRERIPSGMGLPDGVKLIFQLLFFCPLTDKCLDLVQLFSAAGFETTRIVEDKTGAALKDHLILYIVFSALYYCQASISKRPRHLPSMSASRWFGRRIFPSGHDRCRSSLLQEYTTLTFLPFLS
jgi:hypothetical protein